MFRNNYDGVLIRYLEHSGAEKLLAKLHSGPVGGNFGGETTAHKVHKSWILLDGPIQGCILFCL